MLSTHAGFCPSLSVCKRNKDRETLLPSLLQLNCILNSPPSHFSRRQVLYHWEAQIKKWGCTEVQQVVPAPSIPVPNVGALCLPSSSWHHRA